MATYIFNAHVTVSAYTSVEADTEEEARQIADERIDVALGGVASGADPTETWIIDDADGVPFEITMEGSDE